MIVTPMRMSQWAALVRAHGDGGLGNMIRALQFVDRNDFRAKRYAGSFFIEARAMAGLFEFRFFCPCGCGVENSLLIGEGHKPGGVRPSWNWNGSKTEPTLKPSVHQVGHWHGYLRDGYWEVV